MYTKIGFVGVGTMGKPMASNLLKAGFKVFIAPHVNMAPVKELEIQGATVVGTPKEVAAISDVVVTCLPNSPEIEEVVLGTNGLLAGAKPGLVIIDTSTISPIVTKSVSAKVAERGCAFLDAPMSGGQVGAIAGTLTFMVGGDKAAVNSCQEVLMEWVRNYSMLEIRAMARLLNCVTTLCWASTWWGYAKLLP